MANKIKSWFKKMDKKIGLRRGTSAIVFLYSGIFSTIIFIYLAYKSYIIPSYIFGLGYYVAWLLTNKPTLFNLSYSIIGNILNTIIYGIIGLLIMKLVQKKR